MPGETLAQFAPIDYVSKPIEFRDYLHPVVERIAQVIPKDVIWQLYASSPSETGGHIVFPYSRVNAAVMAARDYLRNVKLFPGDKIKLNQYYEKAAEQAFEALVWVEVGFQGLDNLANSPASNNWEGIRTHGEKTYEKCLTEFVTFRKDRGITDDIFSKYNVTYLLDRFSS